VPAGVAADRSSSALLRALLGAGALELMYLLDPPQPIFEGVSRRVGIALLVLRSGPHRPQPAATAQVAVGVVDPAAVWSVTPEALQSRSWNSPWLGQELTGKVRLTVAAGRVAWDDLA